jgi:hypothetical protein
MDRRKFVQGSLLALGGVALPPGAAIEAAAKGETPPRIQYARQEIPSFEIPAYHGTRYGDRVPDTLDLAHRAELGVRVLTSIADPMCDHQVYWIAWWDRNPAVLLHDYNDWVQSVEGLMEVLPLLRVVTGSNLRPEVDRSWMQVALKSIGADGLTYVPLNGLPWSRLHVAFSEPVWRPDGTSTSANNADVAQLTTPAKCGRTIGTMAVYYLRDKNPIWKAAAERMIERLASLTVEKADFAYIPRGGLEPNARFGPDAVMPTGYDAIDYGNVRMIQGLSQYYAVTGYEPARKLAAKLTRFALGPAESFDAQGRFLFSETEKNFIKDLYPGIERGKFGGHFHVHTIALASILEYGVATKDPQALEFVRSSYEWAKTQGSSLVGFFPEMILDGHYQGAEGCEIGDMIGLAVKMSNAGVGDYWDDADRWLRNQFAEQQVTDGSWIPGVAAKQKAKPVESNETDKNVPESVVGGFLGRATGNEAGYVMPHCCTGNCLRAIYYVWENMLERRQDDLRVHLLLNRASEWADVHSHLPYEGRVDLNIKKATSNLWLRAPEWIASGSPEVQATGNGAARPVRWEGRYVNAGAVLPGQRVSVTFPIAERTVRETIGAVPYTLTIKGNTVVAIDPAGKDGPFYLRAHYRESKTRWRTVQRFVSDEKILW